MIHGAFGVSQVCGPWGGIRAALSLFGSGLVSFLKVCRIRTVKRRACLDKYTDG
jgi:hypothetical protein